MARVINIAKAMGLSIYRLAGGGFTPACDFDTDFDEDFC